MRKNCFYKYCCLFIPAFFGFLAAAAQCPASAAFVIKESRCKEYGSITINVTPAGLYSYEITSGPELAAISTSNVFTGLGAGNYIITVYGSSCSANYAATVPGNYQDPGLLTLDSTVPVICPGGTGCITVKQPTQGRDPYRYEVIAGPVTKPIQSSPTFCGLTPGNYTIQSYDSCGVVRTSTFDLGVDTGSVYGRVVGWDFQLSNCNDLSIPVEYYYVNTNSHDQLMVWYVTPLGDTLKVSSFHHVNPGYNGRRDVLPGESRNYGTWQLLIFDECGRIFKSNFDYLKPTYAYAEVRRSTCDGLVVLVQNNWRFNETVHYIIRRCSDSSIIHNETQVPPNTGWWSAELLLNYDSCYFIETFNECGDTLRSTYIAGAQPAFGFGACGSPSCIEIGKVQLTLWYPSGGTLPLTYTILSGPSHVGDSLVTNNPWDLWVTWGGLNPGLYRVQVRDGCGRLATVDVDASKALQRSIDVVQRPHCSGGSNLNVTVTSNYMPCVYNYWGAGYMNARVTSTAPVNYTPINVNIIPIQQNTPGVWQGDFMNVNEDSLYLRVANDGGCAFDTMVRINKYVAPTLHDIKGYVCGTSGTATMNYRVQGGLAPFRFRIKPDNSATWGAWQDSSVFTGLTAGTYDVNIEDACPNGSIRSVSFYNWQKSDITLNTPCANIGMPITLSADPPINLVNYQWLLNNVVVGTGSTYTIPSYNMSHQGVYKLKQVFRGGTCIDSTSSWLLTCSILPLAMGDLKAEWNNDLAVLNWSMLAGVVGMKFQVERSTNGINFSKIGDVAFNGETQESAYRFTDNDPNKLNYYRIAYFTEQGTNYYSQVVKLAMSTTSNNSSEISITPVPFKDAFTLQLKAPKAAQYQVSIHDATGKNLLQRKVNATAGENTIKFSQEITGLPPGSYFVEISGDGFLQRKKVLKQ